MNELPFHKKELCVIAHNQSNLPTAPYASFTPLQGDLKTLSEGNLVKLKKSILKYGIVFPTFIWQHEDTNYIIDAHQRLKALELLEKEGYTISELPYVLIEAKNKKEAAELLLQANSRYGSINPETSFLTDFNIELPFLEEIEIPELTTILDIDYNEEWAGMPEFHQDDKSAYRQIIINFKNEEAIKEFSDKIEQKLTGKTKSIWYPEQEIQQTTDICWKHDES